MSGSINDYDYLCRKMKLASGDFAKNCMDALFDAVEHIIRRIEKHIGFMTKNTPLNKGLRVMIKGFQCNDGQVDPVSIDVVSHLTGSKSTVLSSLIKARNEINPNGGTCPQLALSQMVQEVENKWGESISNNRYHKSLVIVSDAIIYDGLASGLMTSNVINGLRERCLEGITVTLGEIGGGHLSAEDRLTQRKFLAILTSNQPATPKQKLSRRSRLSSGYDEKVRSQELQGEGEIGAYIYSEEVMIKEYGQRLNTIAETDRTFEG